MGKKKKGRKNKTSSGNSRDSRVNRAIGRAKMKMRRWKRYVSEISSYRRRGDPKRWDTAGLERHVKYLESLL